MQRAGVSYVEINSKLVESLTLEQQLLRQTKINDQQQQQQATAAGAIADCLLYGCGESERRRARSLLAAVKAITGPDASLKTAAEASDYTCNESK